MSNLFEKMAIAGVILAMLCCMLALTMFFIGSKPTALMGYGALIGLWFGVVGIIAPILCDWIRK